MHVICVDDEPHCLEAVERALKQIADVTAVEAFHSPAEALEYLNSHDTDADCSISRCGPWTA